MVIEIHLWMPMEQWTFISGVLAVWPEPIPCWNSHFSFMVVDVLSLFALTTQPWPRGGELVGVELEMLAGTHETNKAWALQCESFIGFELATDREFGLGKSDRPAPEFTGPLFRETAD
ncbi:MAG: hypothetical protein ACFBSG_09035 [Leptolyngbyaceae cyanobacterium]